MSHTLYKLAVALVFVLTYINVRRALPSSGETAAERVSADLVDRPHLFTSQTLRNPSSNSSAEVNVTLDVRPGVRLCGCGICALVQFHISHTNNNSSNLSTTVGISDSSSGTVRFEFIEPPVNFTDGWYDATLLGVTGVYASPIATNPNSGLQPDYVHVGTSGRYRVHLSPTHNSTEQAMGVADVQVGLPAESCPLVLENVEGVEKYPLIEVRVPPVGSSKEEDGFDYDDGSQPRWVVSNSSTQCDYNLYFDPEEKNFPLCFHRGIKDYCDDGKKSKQPATPNSSSATANNNATITTTRAIVLGDSHADKLVEVLFQHHPHLEKENGWMATKYHGVGIYLNKAPHYGFNAYVAGQKKPEFVPGKMLENLKTGRYRSLQMEHKFTTWFFQSGHWDLRDTTLGEYERHLAELFREFAKFRDKFRNSVVPFRIVWLGFPAFSYKREMWGGMEMRTNVKLALADRAVVKIARKYGVEVLPFFNLTYPLYRQSCDSHHYVCQHGNLKESNPIGYEFLELVLDASQCLP